MRTCLNMDNVNRCYSCQQKYEVHSDLRFGLCLIEGYAMELDVIHSDKDIKFQRISNSIKIRLKADDIYSMEHFRLAVKYYYPGHTKILEKYEKLKVLF